jgi:hypothetical protein
MSISDFFPNENDYIKKPITANPRQLIIDIVVIFSSGKYFFLNLMYATGGLYDVPLTWKKGVDFHTSSEPSGEKHAKLTRGKLIGYPGGQNINKTHTTKKYSLIWQRKGQAWKNFQGIEEIYPYSGFININTYINGYLVYSNSNADYAFEIDTVTFPLEMVSFRYIFVEPDNINALMHYINTTIESLIMTLSIRLYIDQIKNY